MNRKIILSFLLVLLSNTLFALNDDVEIDHKLLVENCVEILIDTNSTNILDDWILPEWDTVIINRTSIGNYFTVVFSYDFNISNEREPSFFTNRKPNIQCMTNNVGKVIRLTSYELKNGTPQLTEMVEPNEELEEKIFNEMVTKIRGGYVVYAYNSVYRIEGRKLIETMETEIEKIYPDDYTKKN